MMIINDTGCNLIMVFHILRLHVSLYGTSNIKKLFKKAICSLEELFILDIFNPGPLI